LASFGVRRARFSRRSKPGGLAHLDQPQPHCLGQAAIALIAWPADLHLAEPQFHRSGAPGVCRLARRQIDRASRAHRELHCGTEQRSSAGQQAVVHGSAQQVKACLRHPCPHRVDVGLAVSDHRHHGGSAQASIPSRLLRSVSRSKPNRTRAASGKQIFPPLDTIATLHPCMP